MMMAKQTHKKIEKKKTNFDSVSLDCNCLVCLYCYLWISQWILEFHMQMDDWEWPNFQLSLCEKTQEKKNDYNLHYKMFTSIPIWTMTEFKMLFDNEKKTHTITFLFSPLIDAFKQTKPIDFSWSKNQKWHHHNLRYRVINAFL